MWVSNLAKKTCSAATFISAFLGKKKKKGEISVNISTITELIWLAGNFVMDHQSVLVDKFFISSSVVRQHTIIHKPTVTPGGKELVVFNKRAQRGHAPHCWGSLTRSGRARQNQSKLTPRRLTGSWCPAATRPGTCLPEQSKLILTLFLKIFLFVLNHFLQMF